jgi:hypothetical protein
VAKLDEFPIGPDLSILELTDASNECVHGNLPLDPGLDCSCWKLKVRPGTARPKREPPPGRYPEHVKRRAVQMYAEGETSAVVAGRVGVSEHSVRDWARRAGVVVRSRGDYRKAA